MNKLGNLSEEIYQDDKQLFDYRLGTRDSFLNKVNLLETTLLQNQRVANAQEIEQDSFDSIF